MIEKVINKLPKVYLPYLKLMRLDKPVGAWLLMWPGIWSVCLASKGLPDPYLLFVFFIGSFLMRGAGCIINDIVDTKIDKLVERTKTRPLAAGEITKRQALIFLSILLGSAFLLLLTLNSLTIIIGILSIIPVTIYPYMKRITYYPQIFLGLTFNLGALMGWSAVRGDLNIVPIILYVGCILWTVGYDTIYAHQDKEFDLQIGVKSTALVFGDNTKKYLKALYKWFAICLLLVVILIHLGIYIYTFLIPAFCHLYWQTEKIDINNPEDCLKKFKSNVIFGFLVFAAIMGAKIISVMG